MQEKHLLISPTFSDVKVESDSDGTSWVWIGPEVIPGSEWDAVVDFVNRHLKTP